MSLPDVDGMRSQLRAGAAELRLDLPEPQVDKLLDYLALLHKWNSVYNLTAVRQPQEMLTQHVMDCLAAIPSFIGSRRVLDVGSGGGLPGIVIAIWAQQAAPEMQIEMIDTVHKKTAFLTQAKVELGLTNVVVHTGRIEQFRSALGFDVITSRAFAELADFVHWSSHVLAAGGRMIAFKGQAQTIEQEPAPDGWVISKDLQIWVPGMDAERHLLFVERLSVAE